MKLSSEDFDQIVEKALQRLPEEIRGYLDNVLITVRQRPTGRMLQEAGVPRGETLLGLYQGVSLIERSVTSPPLFPDTIFLFQEPLQEMCATMAELEEQIEITLVHEVAHFFGIGDERLRELGYE